jgi:hypothetical protein
MPIHTTFRVRMAAKPVDNVAEAMMPISLLNTTEARERRLSWWDTPALFGPDLTFGPHIPNDQPQGPAFWSYDGADIVLAVDTVGMVSKKDGNGLEPHGQETILDVLSALCGEPDGTIVGGWQGEHAEDWKPLVFLQGRVRQAMPPYGDLGEKERPLGVQPRLIDPSRLVLKDDHVVVRDDG